MRSKLLETTLLSTFALALAVTAQASETGRIVGRIVDAKTGRPLTAAEVGASVPIEGKILFKHARATRQGEFAFDAVEPGNVHLATKLDGFATEHRNVSLAAGETKTVEFSLVRARLVRGVVHNPAGRPQAGAMVKVIYPTEALAPGEIRTTYQWEAGEIYTDAKGGFALAVHPDKDFVLEASHPDFLGAVSAPARAKAAENEDRVVLSLESGVAIVGEVRDARGNAVPGAQVRLSEAGPRRRAPAFTSHEILRQELRMAVTGPDGSFRIDQVKPTTKTIVIVHPGHKTFRQEVELSAAKSGAPLKMVLESVK